MTWAKATNKQTDEVHYDSTPEALDPELYTIEFLDGPPLEPAREQKRSALEALRMQKETGTCQTPIGEVVIDEPSKLKITGALSLCKLLEETAQPFSLNFTLTDGSRKALNNIGIRQLAGAVGL
jgi:hypothetical protein